jgi:hypothetical protein
MNEQSSINDPKLVWQSLETEGKTMSAQEIRFRAERLGAEIRRDTMIGLVFASFLTLAGLIGLAVLPQAGPPERIIITIVVILLWFGAYRTSMRSGLPDGAEFATCLAFYRRELERRRAYFAKPWWPGIIVLVALVQYVLVIRPYNPSLRDLLSYPAALLLLIAIVFPLWRRQVRRFQRELDALNVFDRER